MPRRSIARYNLWLNSRSKSPVYFKALQNQLFVIHREGACYPKAIRIGESELSRGGDLLTLRPKSCAQSSGLKRLNSDARGSPRRRGRAFTAVIHRSVPRYFRAAPAERHWRGLPPLRRPGSGGKSRRRCTPEASLARMTLPLILASRSPGRAALLAPGAGAVRGGRRRRSTRPRSRPACWPRPRRPATSPTRWPSSRRSGSPPGARTGWCSAPTRCWSATACCYDKPEDRAAARAQLAALRGRRHELLSAAVVFEAGRPVWRHIGRAQLTMRAVQRQLPRAPISTRKGDAILASVGAYRLEDGGAQLFARVDGDIFTIIGLPLLELLGFLRSRGSRRGMTAAPPLAGVIGWPIGHSRSPRLHGHWLSRYGIDGYYVPIALAPGGFEAGAALAAAARLPRRERHHPAQGGGAGAGRQRQRAARRGDRCRQHAELRAGRRDPRRQHRRLRLHRQPAPGGAGLATPKAGPALVLGAGGAARAIVAGAARRGRAARSASPTAPARRAEALAAHFGAARRGASTGRGAPAPRRRAADHRQHHLARHGRRRRPAARLRRRAPASAGHRPRLRRRADAASSPRRARAASTPSTGSACCCIRRCRASSAGSAAAGGRRRAARRGRWRDHDGPIGSA